MPAERLVKLPDGISDRSAATLMLKGLTTQYLFRQSYKLKAGETILFHAAAGGRGLIACQWARALGVTMIGTVGSDEKAALAKANGCTHTIVYTRENFVDRVKELTGGKGVPVVYDGIGKDTFPRLARLPVAAWSLRLLRQRVGSVPPFDILLLSAKGSLYVQRPTLVSYATKREDINAMSGELFDLVRTGTIVSEPRQTFPLKDAAEAHKALQSRSTTGATILVP
jgi:NADPH2:quinone reductase